MSNFLKDDNVQRLEQFQSLSEAEVLFNSIPYQFKFRLKAAYLSVISK